MQKHTTLIIENEPIAADLLGKLIKSHCTQIQVMAVCPTIEIALKQIQKYQPVLLFLDVELDNELGFDLFKHYPQPLFDVIFTTSHQEYALQAIEASCLDYLLKPVAPIPLKKAVEKFVERQKQKNYYKQIDTLLQNLSSPNKEMETIAVNTADTLHFLKVKEIICIEAQGNYSILYLEGNKMIHSSKNLMEFEKQLPASTFFRSHRSYLVNSSHTKWVKREGGYQIYLTDDLVVELSSRRKDNFFQMLQKQGIALL